MKFSSKFMILGAAFCAAPAAFAQTAPAAPPAQTTPVAPAAPAAAAQAATFTDTEIQQFAAAALAVEKIRKDATIAEADKGAKLSEAVTNSGLAFDRFNAIARAMGSDPALNQRIQAAAAAAQASQPQGGQ